MFQLPWKLSAVDVPDPAAAWCLVMVAAEAMEAAPKMMAAAKRPKNLFMTVPFLWILYGALAGEE
jgi:hypothetical protein